MEQKSLHDKKVVKNTAPDGVQSLTGEEGGDHDIKVAPLLPFPAVDANKYSRGKAVVCAGSSSYPGAALLASEATQLVGAGYTEVFTDNSNISILQTSRASLVVRPFGACRSRSILPERHPGAVLAGSGMDDDDTVAHTLVDKLIARIEKPMILDGGALAFAAGKKTHAHIMDRARKGLITVLTPHAGEAARLARPFGLVMGVDQERDAKSLSMAYGAIVVLKGPNTVIAYKNQTYTVTSGTSVLAKAGTGDILAGMITGLLAQGLDPFEGCVVAVKLHARAGREAAKVMGPISVCAEDVLHAIPAAICSYIDQE